MIVEPRQERKEKKQGKKVEVLKQHGESPCVRKYVGSLGAEMEKMMMTRREQKE